MFGIFSSQTVIDYENIDESFNLIDNWPVYENIPFSEAEPILTTKAVTLSLNKFSS